MKIASNEICFFHRLNTIHYIVFISFTPGKCDKMWEPAQSTFSGELSLLQDLGIKKLNK
jgi:hypothetical protein